MTETRERILSFVRDFHAVTGRTPTVREIAEALGMYRDTVINNLHQLRKLGYLALTRTPGGLLTIVRYRLPGEAAIVERAS